LGLRAELVYGPVRSGRATPEEIAAAAGALPRVRDRRGLLRRLVLASEGMESYLEEVGAREVLAGPEFAGLVRQHRLRAGSAVYRADAYHAPSRTAFEFDGARFHDPRRLEDSRRDALLASEGVLTVRFGHADVMNRPGWCRDLALRTLRSRVRGDTPPRT
jgi:very-short-patch-repair endonuclease